MKTKIKMNTKRKAAFGRKTLENPLFMNPETKTKEERERGVEKERETERERRGERKEKEAHRGANHLAFARIRIHPI